MTTIHAVELALAIIALAASMAALAASGAKRTAAAAALLAVAGIACNLIWVLRLVPAFKGS
jgi:hypothetical protein